MLYSKSAVFVEFFYERFSDDPGAIDSADRAAAPRPAAPQKKDPNPCLGLRSSGDFTPAIKVLFNLQERFFTFKFPNIIHPCVGL